ncbi:hypothetical protein O9929_23350 [Vibrio lentus]|nr:hypothetical protein [Vibrio lentus]
MLWVDNSLKQRTYQRVTESTSLKVVNTALAYGH